MSKPSIKSILETQLQQLGSRKVTAKEFPQSSRWGHKFSAWTSLSGSSTTFIFIGTLGACRMGQSPSNSTSAWALKEKLLARQTAQDLRARPPKGQSPKGTLTMEDLF